MKEWLENIKQGDEVIVASNGPGRGTAVCRVERLTRTQIIVAGLKFRKGDGIQIGGDKYWYCTLHQATPELKAEVVEKNRRQRIINRLETIRWKDVSTEILEKIAELINVKGAGQ